MMDKQALILDCIRGYWLTFRCPPTLRSLCVMAGITSTSVVSRHLRLMEQAGIILPRKRYGRHIIPSNMKVSFE